MRVFVLQKSNKYVVSSAKNFGKLIYLFREDENLPPFRSEIMIEKISKKLDTVAGGFNPCKDAIAITGPMILVTYLTMVVAARYKRVNILLFDAKQSKYKLTTFLNNMEM